jgi:predicted Zn-dependent peptidase
MVVFNKKVLKNGFTIIHEKRDVPVTTVMLGTRFGSAYENKEDKGIAHFIEHLCFKGTEKRTAREISEEIESVGGSLNAFTHEEMTAYHAKVPSLHMKTAMDVLFDLFFNPVLPEEEIKKEAQVICEEIKMYRDNPRAFVMEKIKQNLYESPFGEFIAGNEKTVLSFTRKKIKEIHSSVYVPANAILVVVGNNSFQEVCSLVEKFIFEKKGKKIRVPNVVLKNNKEVFFRRGIEQTNLAVAFHFPSSTKKESYAAEIFNAILGEGMSSRLFTEVREKRGLVYGIKTELDMGRNYSYFVIWAGTDKEKAQEVIEVSLNEFAKMSLLSEKELEKAKKQVVGSFLVENEDSISTATNLMMFEVCRKAEDYYEYAKNLNKVSLDEIVKLARLKKYSVVVLSPEEDK